MLSWLRLVVVWISVLALPAQGFAASTMAHCGPSHERMHAALVAAQDDAHSGTPAAHHQHTDADASAAAAAPASALSELGQYSCSSCALCCIGLGLLSKMPAVAEPEHGVATFFAALVAVAAFTQTGPDRPPRTALA